MSGAFTITPTIATGFCFFHTTLYVGILYLLPSTRPRRPINPSDKRHESPDYIRLRIRAVTTATILSVLITLAAIKYATGASWIQSAIEIGLWPGNGLLSWVVECAKVLCLVMWLFIGSLWEKFVVQEGWRLEAIQQEWQWISTTWAGWRNIVAGPVTEELVFRAGMVPLQVLAGKSFAWIVWTTPLFFGIGHLHHLYEYLLRHPDRLALGIIRTLFQFTFTTMFGWFTTFVFLRTGSVWTVILVHAFCNYIGVPTFGRIHDQGEEKPKWGQWVNYVHWAGHVIGLWGFCKGLWLLTEGENPLLKYEGGV